MDVRRREKDRGGKRGRGNNKSGSQEDIKQRVGHVPREMGGDLSWGEFLREKKERAGDDRFLSASHATGNCPGELDKKKKKKNATWGL